MRSNRILFTLLAAIALTGCGDEKSGGGSSGGPGGADSPKALVERMASVAKGGALDELIPLMVPEQRGAAAFLFGMLAPSMAMALGDMAGPGEAKDQMAKMKEGWSALLKKHGIQEPKEGENPAAAMMGGDPDDAMAAFDKLMKGVDHQAFVRDSLAFMKSHSDEDKQDMGPASNFKKIDPSKAKIDVDGDRATVTVPEAPTPMGLVKKDGRWYMDLKATMGR